MTEPRYIINVDLETPNVDGGRMDCKSALHADLGPHYDLTVHAISCGSRNRRSAHNPPTRYWLHNEEAGYNLDDAVEQVRRLSAQHPNAYARRCGVCNVPPHTPDWD